MTIYFLFKLIFIEKQLKYHLMSLRKSNIIYNFILINVILI